MDPIAQALNLRGQVPQIPDLPITTNEQKDKIY